MFLLKNIPSPIVYVFIDQFIMTKVYSIVQIGFIARRSCTIFFFITIYYKRRYIIYTNNDEYQILYYWRKPIQTTVSACTEKLESKGFKVVST